MLCQLLCVSLSLASGAAADSGSTVSASAVPGHQITVDRTESGRPVTIDRSETGISVTMDDGDPLFPAGAAGSAPPAVLSLDNASLPGGSDRKEARPFDPADLKDSGRSGTIGRLFERAMAQNMIEGGVAVIGNHNGILSTTARGRLTPAANSPLISDRTIFDLASLTKVIATTPAVMKLLDQGRIALSDPISRWFPEFADPGHEEITVLHLLTHTSGLDDSGIAAEQPMQSAISRAAAQKSRSRLGSHFHYADINFILLGELVRRVSGEPLNAFCQEQIYGPLGTAETMFLPPRELSASIAPTSGGGCGVVQDPNARRLGGVAGHAGLFSSAYDLSRYARMILDGGVLDNKRILSEQIVTQMTSPYLSNNGAVMRGLGWDMNSPFSAPKGSLFSRASFGHTGYSGSSIWIDPTQDLFVILLTNRVNYRDVHSFNQLRRDVSTVAAADFKLQGRDPALATPLEMAKINAELLREVTRVVQSAPRTLKLASFSGRKWQHQSRAQRRACRTTVHSGARRLVRSAAAHRGLRGVRGAKSQLSKSGSSSRKRRSPARRA